MLTEAVGQENPGHMSLNNVYLGRMPGIGRRLTKKGNLGRDVDVGSVVCGKCHNNKDLSCSAVMLSADLQQEYPVCDRGSMHKVT